MPSFVAIDVETANSDVSSICQIGICHFENGEVVDRWETLVNPKTYFDGINESIHGITRAMVKNEPVFKDLLDELSARLEGRVVVTHTHFDKAALSKSYEKIKRPLIDCQWLDSARVARRAWSEVSARGYGLSALAKRLGIEFQHHNALEDATAAGLIFVQAVRDSGQDVEWWQKRVKQPITPSKSSSVTSAIKEVGNPEGPLYGETVVFTGALAMPRREAAVLAAQLGCDVSPAVTQKTTLLVVGDQDVLKLAGHEKSSKHRKAEELILKGQEIRVLMESDFTQLMSI